jgi:hypothetical protein
MCAIRCGNLIMRVTDSIAEIMRLHRMLNRFRRLCRV